MPIDKVVEARHQTQHKLETMDRYWRVWSRILAQTDGRWFCKTHLWLVDTMAGGGLHESIGDPDGVVPGTPFQALLAARSAQVEFPGTVVHVRAIDNDRGLAAKLEHLVAPYRGAPPRRVDVRVDPLDWVEAVPAINQEILAFDPGRPNPGHRSLWLIDPYGVEPLDRRIIEQLPPHAEVVVNFDENSMRRHAGKEELVDLAVKIYGPAPWRDGIGKPTGAFARIFAESFPRFAHRTVYPLRPSGSQDRFFVHLTESKHAVGPFDRAHRAALKAGTLIAGDLLTAVQRHRLAAELMQRFAGQTLTVEEMRLSGVLVPGPQLRSICHAASDLGYGDWTTTGKGSMRWYSERTAEPGLFD